MGTPLKLPKAKKKGYVFCGWTARSHSNIAWFTITGEDTDDPNGSTFFWNRTTKLYAQYAKVTTKKIGKRKLNVNISKWQDASQLEIQYSTNKKFKNAKSIIIKNSIKISKHKKKKDYVLNYNKKKRALSITLSRLKSKKKYYFRFQYRRECIGATCDIYITSIGDWFQKSVKM